MYLDSAASAQQPRAVMQAVERYHSSIHSNVHRGVHTLSQEATAAFEGAPWMDGIRDVWVDIRARGEKLRRKAGKSGKAGKGK